MREYNAFTLKSLSIMNKLITNVAVMSELRDQTNPYQPKLWNALWDTGATNTCISTNIVNDLNLIQLGSASVSTANGMRETNTYRIDILLPNNVTVQKVVAAEADLGDCDLLIGMDIIRHGDFSITNFNRQTTFSFRTPSIKNVDFVKQYNDEMVSQNNSTDEAAPTDKDFNDKDSEN
jgi:hypothetical protein